MNNGKKLIILIDWVKIFVIRLGTVSAANTAYEKKKNKQCKIDISIRLPADAAH